MKYQPNPELWSGVFAVPTEIVDRHLKLAGALQLKVLLWVLRQGGRSDSPEEMAAALGQSVSDVNDAFLYWEESGVLQKGESSEKAEVPKAEEKPGQTASLPPAENPPQKKELIRQGTSKPNAADVVRRGEESPELKFLFSQAQTQFKRTLSAAEQATLLWIFDYCGLPVEVILMLLEFESYERRLTMRNVEKTALHWAELEVDCIEKAEKILLHARQTEQHWKEISSLFGLERRKPTKKEEEFFHVWFDEWNFSNRMIQLAYEINLDQTSKLSFAYINAVLKRWRECGITTPQQAEQSRQSFSKGKRKGEKGKGDPAPASYDIAVYEQMLRGCNIKDQYQHLVQEEK